MYRLCYVELNGLLIEYRTLLLEYMLEYTLLIQHRGSLSWRDNHVQVM